MRIALLSDCYPPRLGGIEVQVHDLAGHLTAAGHEVEVFTATAGPAGEAGGDRAVDDGVVVHRFAMALPWGPLPVPVNPFAVPQVRRRLVEGRFDVAHAHMGVVSPFALDAVRVALGVGVPTAVTWHCVLDASRPVHAALGYAARWARRGAALSAVSAMAARRVATVAGGARVEVLGNGIDTASWARPVGLAEPAAEPLRVVSALRLARRKRPLALVDIAVQARERLLAAGHDLELTVLGDGPQRGAMEAAATRAGLDAVLHLPGRVSRDEVRAVHWGSHVYLAPTRLEAFGIAALEARAAGVPVLARAGTGTADFVRDGVDGLLAADDAALVAGLVALGTDPSLRDRLTTAARSTPPAQDWAAVVTATLAEYARAGAVPS